MEEKNNKKGKLLYTLLGIALLLTLVGGAYAFFSASVSNSSIGGQTQNINNDSLTLTVKKVVFTGATAPSNDLVPAWFGYSSGTTLNNDDPSDLTEAQVGTMLTNKCVSDGFTGCHVYQIKIHANQNITHANLLLNLSVGNLTGASNVVDKSQWGYVVFSATGTVDSSTGETAGLSNPDFNDNNGAPAAIGDDGVTNLDIHNDSSLSTTDVIYYLLVYVNDTGESQNSVSSNTGDENYAVGTYSGSLELQALGGKVRTDFGPQIETAAQTITNLYVNAANTTTATVHGITYNLAPIFNNDDDPDSSGGLMNDRQGSNSSTTTAYGISYNLVEESNNKSKAQTISLPDEGNIRYYGANPNNYVWLGDTYTVTNVIVEGVEAEYDESGEVIQEAVEEVTEDVEVKKLWRIIGVSNGRLKLIQNNSIGDYAWNSSTGNANQWGPSTYTDDSAYEGATLMQLLNNESGDYWTKSGDFSSLGLSENEKSMIDTVTWYLGAYNEDTSSYVDAQYNAERQSSTLGNILCPKCDNVRRTATWFGKVGLMYASDYGYAADLSQCDTKLSGYSDCTNYNWLYSSGWQWTMSPRAYSVSAASLFDVTNKGDLFENNAYDAFGVRPVVYLKSSVTIAGGNGTQSNPHVLQ